MVKECCRCSMHNIPYLKIPKLMVIGPPQNVIFSLNAFLHENGVYELSLLTIVQGKIINFKLHSQVEFGTYTQTRNLTGKNIHACTTGSIAMNPSLNYQCSMLFYSLSDGKAMDQSWNGFTTSPIPEDTIQQMPFIAKYSPMGLVFRDQLESPYEDEEEGNGSITI